MNRQQFNKYLNGQTRPSLSTLRRICDFFGVDEAELLLSHAEFSQLVRLRPPVLKSSTDPLSQRLEQIIRRDGMNSDLLERHEGYYHVYFCPEPDRGYVIRTVSHLFKQGQDWFSKELERHGQFEFAVPSLLKYSGMVYEANSRIVVVAREQGLGQSMWCTMLTATDYATPSFLPGLILGIEPEGSHAITATRVIWEYLGKAPDLRQTLRRCGVYDDDAPELPDFVKSSNLSSGDNGVAILTSQF